MMRMIKQEQNSLREQHAVNEEIYWRAIESRDARFNGVFVYGVRSTGICCKPACPSRRPGRDQVVFFHTCELAEAGGFRACLRCQPRLVSERNQQVEAVMRACRAIEGQTEGTLSLRALSAHTKVSPHHLQRTFKSIVGVTPRQYAAAQRLKQFKSRIRDGADVTSALYDAGYNSSSRLYESATEQLGMTPATYRRGGKGMNINYTIADCHLGRLLVAATERGICAVSFGDDEQELAASLASEYPAATIRQDGTHLREAVTQLLRHLSGAQPHLDLPLDIQATAFQLRVWQELRKIPYGATRSYAEIAAAIGRPTATRAVARACATNTVALVTPCHRVIRGDGHLSGYRWGLERKRALLTQEQNQPPQDDV